MTTTARELAEKLMYDIPIPEDCDFQVREIDDAKKVARYQNHLTKLIEQAILDAEARGRESVLSRVPNKEKIIDYFQDTGDATFFHAWLLAKLKEPT